MTKKIIALTDYISAHDAAQILSLKMGRRVDSHYIHRMKRIRWVRVNRTTKLYHRGDIEASSIRQRHTAEVRINS